MPDLSGNTLGGDLLDQIASGGFRTEDEELAGDGSMDLVTRQMIEASPAFMAQELLRGPPEAPYYGRFLISRHHEEWDHLVTTYDRLCILAPRDHGKTFFFDFAVPIHMILTQPGEITFIFSATKEQATRILGDIRHEIESNPKLSWLVPARKDRWSATVLRFSNGHTIYARGFGTKVRGAHPRNIIVDDGLNDETAYSKLVRDKQKEYFYTAITNMVVPGGKIIVVGTPFHQDDLYGDLKKNPEYTWVRYRALNGPDERPLWPGRYSRERLQARRREIGSIHFTREFQCDPLSDSMSLFPGALFRGDPVEQLTLRLGEPKKFWDELGVTAFMGVDIAMSSTVESDYMVVWVMGRDAHGNRWIMDIHREKGLGFQEQLSVIVAKARKYGPALILIEANQMQRVWGDELIRTTDLPIKKFVTTAQNKHALDKGVPSLRVLLENKKMRIPRGDRTTVEKIDTWIDEMRSLTFAEGKVQSVGGHDDTVMACWICDQAIRMGGFDFSFDGGDEKIDPDALLKELTGEDEESESASVADLIDEDLL